ncbi:MAG: hypothetical protein HYT30_01455 [Parcubacteria group bacterium]|nr:hypothetical protein [Parcubacteria group bacterium]
MKNKHERGFVKILLAVVMLFLAVGTIYSMRTAVPPMDEAAIDDAMLAERAGVRFAWVITALEPDEFGMPKARISLVAGGKEHALGEFDGTCAQQKTDLLEGEQEKVICWWAGGGKEIGVFEEGGDLVVKVGDVDEGGAETGGFRGNFKKVLEI